MAADKGKIKVRVVDFEIEGSDKSLQEALQTLTGALGRPTPQQRSVALSPRPAAALSEGIVVDSEVVYEEEEAPQVQSAPKAPRKAAVPDYQIKDIDLKEGPISWEDFAKAKNPSSDIMKHLVIAYWLKKYRSQVVADPNDAYTLYKAVKWTPPRNMAQPFQDLIKKRDLMKSGGRGLYAINHLGDSEVENLGSPVDAT